jgi:hypothetical protein
MAKSERKKREIMVHKTLRGKPKDCLTWSPLKTEGEPIWFEVVAVPAPIMTPVELLLLQSRL